MVGKANAGMALGFVAALAGLMLAAEKSLEGVPRQALAAVTATVPGARLVSARMVFEDEKTLWEVRCQRSKQVLKIIVTPDGKILRRIEVLEARHLPRGVRKSVEERHAGFLIESAEHMMARQTVTYRVVASRGGERWEMRLDPHGKVLEDKKMQGGTGEGLQATEQSGRDSKR